MSSLTRPSERYSFEPFWLPPFIRILAAEDRCHLNGLVLEDGQPTYVTCVSQTDVNEGRREHRQTGGIVINVRRNEIIADGLSMPHSPRCGLQVINLKTGDIRQTLFNAAADKRRKGDRRTSKVH